MRVLFLANPGRFDTPLGEHYEAGKIYDLTPDRAYKWMTILAIAVEAPPEPKPTPAPKKAQATAPALPGLTATEAPIGVSPPATEDK